jgi:hypothetical protein
MPSPTPTITPTTTPIVCGSGVTQSSYVYYDCCGNTIVGSGDSKIVILDYTRPSVGITKLNIPQTIICPTPTPTVTNTISSTPTKTPSVTSTPTLTQTPTQTNIAINPNNALRQSNAGSSPQNLINSCDVFQSAPLGIQCRTLAIPSTSTSNDGSLAIMITGGTPPYSIYWNNIQNNSEIVTNLSQGIYNILVVDNFGDYSAITSCSLAAPTPTPTKTSTQTPTPTPTFAPPNICFTFQFLNVFYAWTFIPNGIRNGYFTWKYVDVLGFFYEIYWEPSIQQWFCICNSSGSSCILAPGNGKVWFSSLVTSNIPDRLWNTEGNFATIIQPTLNVTSGYGISCVNTPPPLRITNVTTTNSSCGGANDGSITVITNGGVPPLSFTLDNGNSQSSGIFPAVGAGTHTVTVRDSSVPPVILSQQASVITINPSTIYTVYIRNLGTVVTSSSSGPTSTTQSLDWIVEVIPALSPGDTINITISVDSLQYVNGPGFGIITSNNTLSVDGIQQTPLNTTTTGSVTPRPFCPENVTFSGINETYATIQYDSTTVVSGTSTSILTIPSGAGSIDAANCITKLEQDINVNIISAVAQGCACCSAVASSTPGGITNHTFEAQNTDRDQELRIQAYGVQDIKFQNICATTPYRVIWGDTSAESVFPAGCSQAGTPAHTYTNIGGFTGDIVIKMPNMANLDSIIGFTTLPPSNLSSNPKYFPIQIKTSELYKANFVGNLNFPILLAPGLNRLILDDNVLLTGIPSQLPRLLTQLWVKQTTLGGNIADLPSSLNYIILSGDNTFTAYTQGHSWVNNMDTLVISGNTTIIPTTVVDNILQDVSQYSWTNTKLIALKGQRSSNSNSAVSTLTGNGVTVIVLP